MAADATSHAVPCSNPSSASGLPAIGEGQPLSVPTARGVSDGIAGPEVLPVGVAATLAHQLPQATTELLPSPVAYRLEEGLDDSEMPPMVLPCRDTAVFVAAAAACRSRFSGFAAALLGGRSGAGIRCIQLLQQHLFHGNARYGSPCPWRHYSMNENYSSAHFEFSPEFLLHDMFFAKMDSSISLHRNEPLLVVQTQETNNDVQVDQSLDITSASGPIHRVQPFLFIFCLVMIFKFCMSVLSRGLRQSLQDQC